MSSRTASAPRVRESGLGQDQGWLAAQKEAFRSAMDGAPLEESLGILLAAAVEQINSGMRCAFYLVDPDGSRLHHLVGMSASYARAVDNFAVSPESLACGLAVARGEPVITPDIRDEPRWQPWLWLAQDYDYRGCWSFPVETATGELVGSLAMYFRQPRKPRPGDDELAAALTQAAAIIISRSRAETALRDKEERLSLLVAELQHRTRNLLSIVSGIADQSRSSSSTVEEFGERMDHRLAALGRVQGLLSTGLLPSIGLDELILMELSAHGIDARSDARIAVDGPDVALPADAVQLFSLALHELTTNALKHGALRTNGRIEIGWTAARQQAGRVLDLRWVERGVPIGDGELARGFGRELIETNLPYELDAITRLDFGSDGLSCSIQVVLPSTVDAETALT